MPIEERPYYDLISECGRGQAYLYDIIQGWPRYQISDSAGGQGYLVGTYRIGQISGINRGEAMI